MVYLFEDEGKITESVKDDLLSLEEQCVRQLIATRAIHSPKLTINEHKTVNNKGEFIIRLVILTKIYDNIIQDQIPGNKEGPRQDKCELLTSDNFPNVHPKA